MDAECQDERAAGVCSGDDPYKELELYLEKVNEEIGEVFDRWKTAPVKKPSSPRIIPLAPPRKASLPPPPLKAANGHHRNGVPHAPRRLSDDRKHYDRDYGLSEWSDTLLAEFNSIIARELHQFQTDVVVKADDAEDVFLTDAEHVTDGDMMRIKAYRSRSWDNYNVNDSDSSGHGRGTPPPSPSTSSTSDTSSSGSSTGIHHRTSGLARVLRRHRAQVPTVLPPGEPLVGAPVLVRVSSLPDTDTLHAATAGTSPREPRELLPVPRIRNAHSYSGLLDKMAENKNEHEFALCGIPNGEHESGVVSMKVQSKDVLKDECESVGSEIVGQCVLLPSVVLNHNGGIPSNSLPDGKVSKGYTNVSGKSPKPSALASKMLNVNPKSSLPFSNICLPEDKSHSLPSSAKVMASIVARKECSSSAATSGDEGEVKCAGSLPDLVIAEKQQVADDDVTTTSATAASRRQEMRVAAPLPTALHNFLTKIRPRRGRGHSPSNGSPSRSFSPGPSGTTGITGCYLGDSLLNPVDAGTQTSPGMSRSSSFTWVSDCSSLLLHSPDSDTLDDDNRSTTSSTSSESIASPKDEDDDDDDDFEEEYDASSMGEEESAGSLRHRRDEDFSSRDSLLSSSSPRSVDSPDRDEEQESGIGTASPPRSKGVGSVNKARRKETWERFRKRPLGRPPRGPSFKDQEVWIRREHVETQTTTTTTTSPNDDDICCGGAGVDIGDGGGGGGDTQSPDDATSTEDLRPADTSSGRDETTSAMSLSMPRVRAARPQCLAVTPSDGATLGQDGYVDQPSPSTASLKMNTMPLPTELGSKSSSAPMLIKKPATLGAAGGRASDTHNKRSTAQSRSQSERHLAEIEAGEACKWLRAAGFPQYAQMYEDMQFPIDVSGVQKDHPFLDPDSLQSLYRRLSALNHCAKMKVEHLGSGGGKKRADDSDEDDNSCALSENWTFQHESRRWSRVCDVTQDKLLAISASSHAPHDAHLEEEEDDSYELDDIPVISPMRYGSLPPCNPAAGDADLMAVRFRRTGSERLRDGAKALLRRMESLKTRRRKRQHRDGVVISGPQVLDVTTMNQRMRDLNCVDVSPVDGSPPPFPPAGAAAGAAGAGEDSCSDGSASTTPHHQARQRRRRDEPGAAMSDSEMLPPPSWGQQYLKDANSNHTKVLEFIDGRSRGSKDQDPRSSRGQIRTGSLNLGKDSQRFREKYHQHSLRRDPTSHRERYHSHDDSTHVESDREDSQVTPRHKASVVRWHSFQRGSTRPDSSLFRLAAAPAGSRPMGSLSCGQLLVLRKLALLKLTACMERYCPTHRTGWNWELPKFIRKIKAPDYKDKTVFGVPLLLSLQRNGQALPKCIQMALRWLRTNALDQVGLFRKSGVRSRIQRLKLMTESQGDAISYEGQQAYDVADMVKQYFRELPEALLTNKLSETFIAIFQHVPAPLRHDAVQCVLLLLPDEHREALQTLVEFLEQVSAQSALNQMTASNLAVCLAPSLFHLHHAPGGGGGGARSASASPRRKTVGAPDPRELGENRAAHDCLLYLVREHRDLFMVGEEMLTQCHFSYMEQSIPVALEELGAEFRQDWRGYLYACTTALLKEAREKSRGWVSVACSADPQVDMSYRKVGDGHPLRLWRVSTEVEAPPLEVLHRVLRERHVWDHSLLKWRVVQQLDQQVEVFQYVCANMAPSPAKDFCVLRSWRSDLPKGACVVVETSVEHPNGSVMLGGVRGIVLASRYLIEPCGSGRSRIMHLSRVDTKGRTPEWYNKSYGHICALHLSRIRGSFKRNADGPESKV